MLVFTLIPRDFSCIFSFLLIPSANANAGLIACRICGVVKERVRSVVNLHVLTAHSMTLDHYLSRFRSARVSTRQTPAERRASEAARSLRCTRCGADNIGGIKALQRHLLDKHRNFRFRRNVSLLVGEVAEQLGLRRCGKCLLAVEEQELDRHRKSCVEGADCGRRMEEEEEQEEEEKDDEDREEEEKVKTVTARRKRTREEFKEKKDDEMDSRCKRRRIVHHPECKSSGNKSKDETPPRESSHLKLQLFLLMPRCP